MNFYWVLNDVILSFVKRPETNPHFMKNLFLLFVFALPLAADAQFNKGDVFLGGSLSGNFQNGDMKTTSGLGASSRTYNTFRISPSVGFFVNEKIAIAG